MKENLLQKELIQETAEATGDLIDNKIADKLANISKSLKELHSKALRSQNEDGLEIPKERYTAPEKRHQIIDEFKLV